MVILQDSCKTNGYLARFMQKNNLKKHQNVALGEEKIIQIIAQVNTHREDNCSANIEIFSFKSFFLYI